MAKRKRAPGGGRKPQGEFDQLTSPFSLRMPDDMRAQLEAAAKNNGRSASQELLARLNVSFARERAKNRDQATWALCFLVSELIEKIKFPAPEGWHKNPFLFAAFRTGLEMVLGGLQPAGKEVSPIGPFADEIKRVNRGQLLEKLQNEYADQLVKDWKSSRQVGSEAAKQTVLQLFMGPSLPPDQVTEYWAEDVLNDPTLRSEYESDLKFAERILHGMEHARHALEVGTHSKKRRS